MWWCRREQLFNGFYFNCQCELCERQAQQLINEECSGQLLLDEAAKLLLDLKSGSSQLQEKWTAIHGLLNEVPET